MNKPPTKRSTQRSPDRFDLYEAAVTNAASLARFCRALHAGRPRVLGEDFSGTAALARAWLLLDRSFRAVGVDMDPAIIKRTPRHPRLTMLAKDVLKVTRKVDVLAATNFPVMYWHTRPQLVTYLKHARTRLNKGGVFVCDLYGGPSALQPGTTTRRLRLPDGTPFQYAWQQRRVDAVAGIVENAIHFKVLGNKPQAIRNAFEYTWRLWSIPELREAMDEAGFATTEVHDRLGGAVDGEGNLYVGVLQPDERLDENYVVYVAARA